MSRNIVRLLFKFKVGGNNIMPFRDGTGPNGEGPNTGKGLGLCGSEKDQQPEFDERPRWGLRRNLQLLNINPQGFGGRGGSGRGRGRGGRGRGRG